MFEETFPQNLGKYSSLCVFNSTHYLIRWNWYLVVDNKSLYFNSDGNSSCWRQHFHVFGNKFMFNKQICSFLYIIGKFATKSNTWFIFVTIFVGFFFFDFFLLLFYFAHSLQVEFFFPIELLFCYIHFSASLVHIILLLTNFINFKIDYFTADLKKNHHLSTVDAFNSIRQLRWWK